MRKVCMKRTEKQHILKQTLYSFTLHCKIIHFVMFNSLFGGAVLTTQTYPNRVPTEFGTEMIDLYM